MTGHPTAGWTLQQLREAISGDSDVQFLLHDRDHIFRLATKRLRYSLVLFHGLYGPGLVQRIEVLRQAQDLLGTASGLKGRAQHEPALQPVVDELEGRAEQKREEFRRFRHRTLSETVIELRWINYFKRNAGGRRPWLRPHHHSDSA